MPEREEIIEFARGQLGVRAYEIFGTRMFIAWECMTDEHIARTLATADFHVQNSLLAWVARAKGPLPKPVQDFLDNGETLSGRGKRKAMWRHQTALACAEALRDEFGIPLYYGDDTDTMTASGLDGTTCDYIAEITGLQPVTVRDLIKRAIKARKAF